MPQQLNKKLIPYKAIEVENADEILSILCNAFPSCSFERPVGMKCLPRNKKDSNTLKEEAQRIADLFFFRPELVTRSLSGSVEIPKDEAMERLKKQVDLVKDENITTLSQLPWDSLTARFRKLIRRDDTPATNLFTQAEVKVESENGIYYVYFSFTPRKQEHCPLTALMTSCIAIEKDQNMGLRVSCSALSGDFAREVVRTVPVWAEKVVTHLCYYLDSGKRADVNMPIRQVPIGRYFENLLRVREHPVVKDLSKVWNNYEKTDKSKHLFEDVGIVAYLATLFESLDMKDINFVDIGCGNGVNTYLLNTLFGDHIKGIGYDLQQRRIWSYYEEQGQRDMLHLQPITPNWPQLEQPFPPETNFLVGVHTDELTPWIPLFAMIRHCNFFILPCCPYDFYGKFRRSGNEPFDSDWPYLDHIVNISRNLGFNVRVDNLKIPSQKKTCVIGTVPEDGQLLVDKNKYWEMVMDQMLTPSLKANGCRGFTVRPKVDQSRNVTNLPRDTRDIINEAVVKVLLDHDSEGCLIADLADELPIDIIKELKRQNGGLQTFIKINKAGYILEKGKVRLRSTPFEKFILPNKTFQNCFFEKFLGNCRCRDMCGYTHVDSQ